MTNVHTPTHALLDSTTDFVHWRDITPPIPGLDQYGDTYVLSDVSFPTASDGWVVASQPGSLILFRTRDGGSTWQNLGMAEQGGSAGEELVTFTDASHGWRQIIAPTGGQNWMSVTADGGQTWNDVVTPGAWPSTGLLTFSATGHGFSADTLPPTFDLVPDLPISAFSPLWETTDGGTTWRQSTVTTPAGFAAAQTYTGLPTFLDADQGVLPVALFVAGTSVAFYTSSNGGSTWSFQNAVASTAVAKVPGYEAAGQLPAVGVASTTTWWVIGGVPKGMVPSVRVTTNAGASWTNVTTTGLPADIASLQAVSSWNAWATTTADGLPAKGCGLFSTGDGGRTWQPVCPGR